MADQRRKQNHSPGVRNVKPSARTVRKSKKRRRLRARIFLTVLFAAGICATLSLTVLFRVSAVEAEPGTHYTAEQITEAAGIENGTNLFRVDRAGAAQKISRTLPYIESASVSIVLPDKIFISVQEAEPALQIQQDGSCYLLSGDLKVLERFGEEAPDLPVITGAGLTAAEPGTQAEFEKEEMPQTLLTLEEQLKVNQFSQVTAIDVTRLYSIELSYDEKITVRIGSLGNLQEKLQLARYIIDNKLDADQAGTLDLSQENGQAIFRPDYGSNSVILPPGTSSDVSG